MRLTVIIVSYNVRYFLEQCLCSVSKAVQTMGENVAEIIVVDNDSKDGTINYLKDKFPSVSFISNKENVGFAKANNQALRQARGKYVLFLNPDTILPEDIFRKTISFMDAQPAAGALGVKMIDGSGQFLKESKRGLPTAWASFCKMSGLTSKFERSKIFASYYLGHLPENKTQPVQVLSGAFLMVRKEIADELNGFDEQFFMYAEDIDLSYRILKLGYENFYFADSCIIHFKGESTKKDVQYVKLFYKAMHQFVRKHYRSGAGLIFSGMLTAAIRLRSGFAQLKKKKDEPPKASITQAALEGDLRGAARLNALLLKSNVKLQEGSDNIILCEGESYSFSRLIERLQQLKAGQQALIHAANSNSIVGSFDKDNQGTVMVII
jgi:N-acetylglucosaminyl-diphospho-decaprenol L-rhamnosyltransferase